MGGGSKTTTTNTNQQATTTPTTPDYALGPVQNYFEGVANYQNADPYAFVTPINSLQKSAMQNASGLYNNGAMFGQAAQGANAVLNANPATNVAALGNLGPANTVNPASLLENFSAYLNPATDALVNTTLADMDANAGNVRAQQAADAARNGAFGGSRYGVAQAGTEGELARARASADANLRAQAWNSAAGLSQSDAANRQQAGMFNAGAQNQFGLAGFDARNQMNQFNVGQINSANQQALARQLQASGLMADIGSAYGQDYRQSLGTEMDMGNDLYNLENIQNQAPLTQLQNVGNLLNPGMIDTLSSKTVTGSESGTSQEKSSGGLFNSLLGIASLAVPFIPGYK